MGKSLKSPLNPPESFLIPTSPRDKFATNIAKKRSDSNQRTQIVILTTGFNKMGSIRERIWSNGTKRAWQLSYIDANGERHAEQYRYKRDAQFRLSVIESELVGGYHTPRSQNKKLKDVVPEWIDHKQNFLNRAHSTVSQLNTHANRHILPRIGERSITSISPRDVRDFFDDLSANLSSKMASYVARSFRDLMNFSVGKGYIARNVATGIKIETPSSIYRDMNKTSFVPTTDIISAILSNSSPEIAAEIACSALAGLRSEEVRALMWKDIDFKGGQIHISRAANRKNLITTPKTIASTRTIPMSSALNILLKKWNNCSINKTHLVFPSKNGRVKTYEFITRREFYPLLERLEINRFGWHQLRDFFATTMVYHNIQKEQLKFWMGHNEYSTTEKYYVNNIKNDNDIEKISNAQKNIIFINKMEILI